MREYRLSIDGEIFRVKLLEVEKDGSFLVEVNNKRCEVRIGNEIRYGVTVSVEVDSVVHNVEFKQTSIKVNKNFFSVEYDDREKRKPSESEPKKSTFIDRPIRKFTVDIGVVTTPMPGQVVSLEVKKGDRVEVGDVICVLEAMKMENEITAPKAGTISEVNVSEGDSVKKGEILVKIT